MQNEYLFAETLKEVSGFFSSQERGTVHSLEQIIEADNLIFNGTYKGASIPAHQRAYMIREALTTSDFPNLFGDVLQRQMLAEYKAAPADWKKFTKLSTVPRILPLIGGKRFALDGGDDALALIPEKGEYQASPRTETKYDLSVAKYGRQFDISWESLVNDDMGALKDTPKRFSKAALRTEHRVVTSLYSHNVVMATAGRGNLSVNPLTIANLETAIEWFGARTDVNGEAIPTRPKYLVVPPALEMTALAILNSSTVAWSDNAGGPVAYPINNVVAKMGLQLVVDPYITILNFATTPLSAVGAWFLFTDPGELTVLEAAHLSGHERPEICMKNSDKVTIGGGAINAMSGDFATDNIFYRVRLVFGAATMDWRGFYFGGHLD